LAAVPATVAHAQTAGEGGGAAKGFFDAPLTVDYSINARQEYVDNIGFSGRSTFVSSFGPAATFRMDSETVKLAGGVALSSVHYSNSQAGRSRTTQPRFNFNGSLIGERGVFNLQSSFYKDSSFNSTTPQGTAGFQLSDAQRTFFSFAPSYSRSLTERLSLNAGYTHTNAFFDRSAPGLIDNDSNTLSTGLQYRLTELDTVGVSVSASKFNTSPETTASDSKTIQVSWNRRWSEVTTISAFLGVTDSEVRGRSNQLICLDALILCQLGFVQFTQIAVGTTSSSTSPTYGFTLATQLTPRTSVGAQGNRGIQAGGAGSLIERELLSADLAHRFTERMSASLDLSHQTTRFVGANVSRALEVTTLSGALSYSLPDEWALSAGARFAQADFGDRKPHSSSVFVNLSKGWRNNRVWR
jgi:hypothetical protein